MPRMPRMFGSHGSHIWLACLARLAHMPHTFGSHASHVWLAGSHIGHTPSTWEGSTVIYSGVGEKVVVITTTSFHLYM